MKKIQLDFAPASVARTVYKTSFVTWFILLTGLLACVEASIVGLKQKRQADIELNALHSINQKIAQRSDVKPVTHKKLITEAQATAVNAAIAQLNLPWRQVFDAIEAATPKTIALLSLEPDARRNSVRGIAEAKDSEDMVLYIEQLKKQSFFRDVYITMHDVNQSDPNKPMRFQFEANWQNSLQGPAS